AIETKVDYYDEIERKDYPWGRNLILNSDITNATDSYLVGDYLTSLPFIEGVRYSSLLYGEEGGKAKFRAWQNGTTTGHSLYDKVDDELYSTSFIAQTPISGREFMFKVYQYPSSDAGFSIITKITLILGSEPTPWSPAPEDLSNLKGK